jgi:D-arabinose 1-dehydrogenase-like Zn-dependent alcohol dehydrogenase
MKAAVIPAKGAMWELREVPTPTAEPWQVLIKVHACGICFTDIWTMLSYEQAAPLFCVGYTTWSGLRAGESQPGETIAVVGIGGLGHLALQYSKACGFKTVAVTHPPNKRELATRLGADVVVADGAALHAAGGANLLLLCSNSYEAGRLVGVA